MRLSRGINAILRRNRRPGSPRKGGRRFFSGGKLFGRGPSYERVLEDGVAANEFELGDADSDEAETEHSDSSGSEGSRLGRSSGLMTPKVNVVAFESNNYFDGSSAQNGVGLGLNNFPNAMDRSGLVVRTESRERLGPSLQMLGAGRRSRAGSPTRMKSPLMAPLEEG